MVDAGLGFRVFLCLVKAVVIFLIAVCSSPRFTLATNVQYLKRKHQSVRVNYN